MARHKHYDAIVAWAEGKEIECRNPISLYSRDWTKHDSTPLWREDFEYRVKPKLVKREGWIALYGDYAGDGFPSCCGIYPTEEACRDVNNGYNDGHRVVKISWEEEE